MNGGSIIFFPSSPYNFIKVLILSRYIVDREKVIISCKLHCLGITICKIISLTDIFVMSDIVSHVPVYLRVGNKRGLRATSPHSPKKLSNVNIKLGNHPVCLIYLNLYWDIFLASQQVPNTETWY